MKPYQKIILIGTAIVTVLMGCLSYKNGEIIPRKHFQNSAYHYLVDNFTVRGLHNLQSPLFDFDDSTITQTYEQAKNSAIPQVFPIDTQSNYSIIDAVERHLVEYGDRALIIISGAGVHIWGATNTLEDKFDAEYISITSKKLDLENVMDSEVYFRDESQSEKIEKAEASLDVQLTRGLGVVKHMGYRDVEDYMRDISDFDGAKNIVIGKEETGLHDQYTNQDNKPIYDILSSFIEQFKPNSILYIREDLPSEDMRRNFENGNLTQIDVFTGEPYYRTQFLNKAKELNIPVEFASFGGPERLVRDFLF